MFSPSPRFNLILSFLFFLTQTFTLAVVAQGRDGHEAGRLVYENHCAVCHGTKGDGQGEAAVFFQTKPRNFTKGEYKIKSTASGSPPLDEDLIRSVKFGLPGTAMTPQNHLSDEEIRAVVAYIKLFSPRFTQTKPSKPIAIPPAPPAAAERVARGRVVYQKSQCLPCHGPDGKGDGVLARTLSVKPTDLTRRPFKSGPALQDIARTLLTGIEGTPMPPYQFILEGQDLWNLTYYIDSLGGKPQQTDDERKGWEIIKKQHGERKGGGKIQRKQ